MTEQFTAADRHMAESIIRTCDADEAELWAKLIRIHDCQLLEAGLGRLRHRQYPEQHPDAVGGFCPDEDTDPRDL